MCGKNDKQANTNAVLAGSPPRVREKLISLKEIGEDTRITPACAGKTTFSAFAFMIPRDHPRVCGKNSANLSGQLANLGSPPRVREKLNDSEYSVKALRITPACAGKTPPRTSHSVNGRDHPRVCGKNLVCKIKSR